MSHTKPDGGPLEAALQRLYEKAMRGAWTWEQREIEDDYEALLKALEERK